MGENTVKEEAVEPIVIWDVFCRVNETAGIMGAGIVFMKDGKIVRRTKLRFESMGKLTHNLCELLAIRNALQPLIKRCTDEVITIYSASNYACNAVSQPSKVKANKVAVLELREILTKFKDACVVTGMPEEPNRKADQLAWQSVRFEKDVKHVEVSRYCSK